MFRIQPGNGGTTTKTIRMPSYIADELERLAKENHVSFSSAVSQCVQYALQSMSPEERAVPEKLHGE